MARTNTNDSKAAGHAAATAPTGGDVKVDIEVEGTEADEAREQVAEQDAAEQPVQDEGAAEASADADAAEVEPEVIEMDDEAMVEAAKRAGEAAAEEDFKSQATGLEAERDELAKKLADVEGEIESARAEATAAADKAARLQADWENYRRRVERERVIERERACEGLVKDLLPAIDDLERAIAHAGTAAEGNEVAKQLADGVSAVHAKVIAVLEKQGAEVIDPAGQAFDPNDHQAVGRVENADVYDETVNDVYQKGYRLGGKVIRPAMVTVTYGGAKRPAEPEADGEAESK